MTTDHYVAAANEYAAGVVRGDIPACLFVRQACQRQIDDLAREDWPYYFSEEAAHRFCEFFERLPHVKGEWARPVPGDVAANQIRLQPWQCFIWTTVYGWLRKSDDKRRFRSVYGEIPRKNGKSIQGAGVGDYMFAADGEPGAEVYSGATTEKQAWEVFGPARLMAQKADGFADAFGVMVNAKNMSVEGSASKFEPVIGNPGDGASPHCALVDEYHEHKTPDQYDTMLTGMGARTQPLMVVITTAGSDISGPCYDLRDESIKVLSGVVTDEEAFAIIYTIDDDDDWTDFEVWRKANPNMGVSVSEDFLRSRLEEGKRRASRQNILKCKHLNVWSNARTAWINMQEWDACKDESLTPEQFLGEPCIVALDLASRRDIAARIEVYPRDIDGKKHYYMFGRYYLPESTVQDPKHASYRSWVNGGWITETDGNETDFGMIEDDIIGVDGLASRVQIDEVAYDPWQATQFAQNLQAAGANAVEFRATVANFSDPMKETDAAIASKRLHHNGDPVMAWMISNVTAKEDAKGNIYPRKDRDEAKIDGPVALIMAIGRAMVAEPVGESIYSRMSL